MIEAGPITERELNRALLARQGLHERIPASLPEVVTTVGALQMQHWPALGPALWTRSVQCPPSAPYRAHAEAQLLTGTLLRGTIHTVTAADYPAYAAVWNASKAARWRPATDTPPPDLAELRHDLRAFASQPRRHVELAELCDAWVGHRPTLHAHAEIAFQRQQKWRPFLATAGLVRVPADGQWGPRTPLAFQTAPVADLPPLDQALPVVVRAHLRAFGPAATEDVASWTGFTLTPVRRALQSMDDLVTLSDEHGRTLYDLSDAPRPDGDLEAPVRLLPWFDSALLAYAPGRRTRILPDAHRETVIVRANGQVRATFLVDGQVAGLWSIDGKRRAATLTLQPLQPLTAQTRRRLIAEAERMLAFCRPDAATQQVTLTD